VKFYGSIDVKNVVWTVKNSLDVNKNVYILKLLAINVHIEISSLLRAD
jgi:hypothetical protein